MCGEKLQGHSSFVRIQCLICHGRSTCGGGREVEVVVLQLVVLSMCSRNKQGLRSRSSSLRNEVDRDSKVATKSETGMNARAANFFTRNLKASSCLYFGINPSSFTWCQRAKRVT